MIPQDILNKTDIVVSYCTVQGGSTNAMGHAYLLFSYYCPKTQQMVVDDAIGFYPIPIPIERTWRRTFSTVNFFDQGYLTQEKYRYLIPNATSATLQHQHKSWKITPEQYLALTQKISADRGIDSPLVDRNFAAEHQALLSVKQLPSDQKKQKLAEMNAIESAEDSKLNGPYFNVLNNSCKGDSLKRLNAIGIETAGMHNRLVDLPVYSGRVSPFQLGFDENTNQFIWKSPIELSPQKTFDQESKEMQNLIAAQRQYHLLMSNLKDMIHLFDLKLAHLKHQPNNLPEKAILLNAHNKLNQLLNTMQTQGIDPNHLTQDNIDAYFNNYQTIISETKDSLTPLAQNNNRLTQFLQKISDKFIELCTQFGQYFGKTNIVIYSENHLLDKAEQQVNALTPRLKAGCY